jgi:hypothetical protein
MRTLRLLTVLPFLATSACAQVAPQAEKATPNVAPLKHRDPMEAPFPRVWAKAFHILPETHSDESGYFSIVEGKNGKIYIGTAKYNINAFLVEFDPKTEQQKIVIDTNKVNGLTATGYASQSKIHTRNFVGPSGTIYVGSQEGYRTIKGDDSKYPGGYVMTYNPETGEAKSLGMPMAGEGVIDVVADEARGLLYIVTSTGEDKLVHWLVGDIKTKTYREIGPLMTPYATTLMDSEGRAHAITQDFQMATYDPDAKQLTLRGIEVGGKKWVHETDSSIPTWQLTPDKKAAYLVLLNDPTLFRFPFDGTGAVQGEVLGRMIEGTGYDSRSSLTVAPDGRVYALYKINNETGFGSGYLHHLTRYDPKTKKTQDLGVLAVQNPDFFDFGPRADGTKPPWSHGYHTLPDGALTPLHGHQGLIAARDGNLYALILYPYTLLKIEGMNSR